MNESQFKCAAVKLLKKELPGAWVYHPSDRWVSGIPDLFIIWRGVFAAVELKVGKNQATKLQEITLGKIAAAGGVTRICRDVAGIREVIEKIKEEAYEGTRPVSRL
jgi:hypothetical protein